MSAVINQSKQTHYKALRTIVILFVLSAFLVAFLQIKWLVSLILGGGCAIMPYAVFVYWFFNHSAKKTQNLTAFYKGEALKWGVAIVLIIVAFKTYSQMNFLVFFLSFFLMLMCNSLLPFFFSLKQNGITKTKTSFISKG
ncbi:F0F1 ATP synthase subunit I [Phocoenobacter uteri]|uniref:F0F1 ATP synthase subunit I n=1 Tax=Phocoenobacter uteri TaxID=146806 RepID=A0A379CB68_9PAST|nr:ATP synthase subunit I [Phocoenobacter uteri]MDG6881464.1 hypothetical protein [Phocoenobacter uteri]SUB59494.1 F0F1 ATP synthase subunit I [Phocoenobacter uteri]